MGAWGWSPGILEKTRTEPDTLRVENRAKGVVQSFSLYAVAGRARDDGCGKQGRACCGGTCASAKKGDRDFMLAGAAQLHGAQQAEFRFHLLSKRAALFRRADAAGAGEFSRTAFRSCDGRGRHTAAALSCGAASDMAAGECSRARADGGWLRPQLCAAQCADDGRS